MTSDGGGRFLGNPRFDVVLRGYDRRQVDEHVERLQRVVARLRADLDVARSQQLPPTPSRGFQAPSQVPPAARPRPSPRPRPRPDQLRPGPGGQAPDVVDGLTDRMQSILRAAEEEAAEIRRQATASARGDETLRSQVAGLVGERNAMLTELARMRTQLEGLTPAPAARSNPQPPYAGVAAPPAASHPPPPVARSGWGTAADQSLPSTPGPATPGPASSVRRPFPPPAVPRPAAQTAGTDAGDGGPRREVEPWLRPDPEPFVLLHPTIDGASEPDHVAQQVGADGPAEMSGGIVDRTVAVQAVRPATEGATGQSAVDPGADQSSAPVTAVEATVKVAAVPRPGSDVEATVPGPPRTAAAMASTEGETGQDDAAPSNGSPDAPPADGAQPGTANDASRSASASRSG